MGHLPIFFGRFEHKMGQSGGLTLADGWTAATPYRMPGGIRATNLPARTISLWNHGYIVP